MCLATWCRVWNLNSDENEHRARGPSRSVDGKSGGSPPTLRRVRYVVNTERREAVIQDLLISYPLVSNLQEHAVCYNRGYARPTARACRPLRAYGS
jgi:hypothetical protein